MPFGLGVGELVLILTVLCVPIVLVVLAVKLASGFFGGARKQFGETEQRQVAAELERAHLRIEELEARVARVDEKASFTQELIDKPRGTR